MGASRRDTLGPTQACPRLPEAASLLLCTSTVTGIHAIGWYRYNSTYRYISIVEEMPGCWSDLLALHRRVTSHHVLVLVLVLVRDALSPAPEEEVYSSSTRSNCSTIVLTSGLSEKMYGTGTVESAPFGH
jgi:hypothetical protein